MWNSGRVALLSNVGRADLVERWFACLRFFWPAFDLPVDVLDSDKELGWARAFHEYLESIRAPWVFLWVDDNWIPMPVKHYQVMRAFWLFSRDDSIAVGHPARSCEGLEPIRGFPEYGWFPKHVENYLGRAMIPMPCFWRTEALHLTTADCLSYFTEEQDRGWTGFYNWELNGQRALARERWRGFAMHSPAADSYRAPPVCNAVRQGSYYSAHAYIIADIVGFQLSPQRLDWKRFMKAAPAVERWKAAGHPIRK